MQDPKEPIWNLSIEDLFVAPHEQAPVASAVPVVINLRSSGAPIRVPHLPDFEHLRVYRIEDQEHGRPRFRMRLGFFETRAAAEAALGKLRDEFTTAFIASVEEADLPHASEEVAARVRAARDSIPKRRKEDAKAASGTPDLDAAISRHENLKRRASDNPPPQPKDVFELFPDDHPAVTPSRPLVSPTPVQATPAAKPHEAARHDARKARKPPHVAKPALKSTAPAIGGQAAPTKPAPAVHGQAAPAKHAPQAKKPHVTKQPSFTATGKFKAHGGAKSKEPPREKACDTLSEVAFDILNDFDKRRLDQESGAPAQKVARAAPTAGKPATSPAAKSPAPVQKPANPIAATPASPPAPAHGHAKPAKSSHTAKHATGKHKVPVKPQHAPKKPYKAEKPAPAAGSAGPSEAVATAPAFAPPVAVSSPAAPSISSAARKPEPAPAHLTAESVFDALATAPRLLAFRNTPVAEPVPEVAVDDVASLVPTSTPVSAAAPAPATGHDGPIADDEPTIEVLAISEESVTAALHPANEPAVATKQATGEAAAEAKIADAGPAAVEFEASAVELAPPAVEFEAAAVELAPATVEFEATALELPAATQPVPPAATVECVAEIEASADDVPLALDQAATHAPADVVPSNAVAEVEVSVEDIPTLEQAVAPASNQSTAAPPGWSMSTAMFSASLDQALQSGTAETSDATESAQAPPSLDNDGTAFNLEVLALELDSAAELMVAATDDRQNAEEREAAEKELEARLLAEEERLLAEQAAEATKQEAQRAAEAARVEAEQAAEAAKREAERIAESERAAAAAARAEAERIAEEARRAEAARLEAERVAEAERAAAAAARAEAERILETARQAEAARLEAERVAEAERAAAAAAREQAERFAEEARRAEAARLAAEQAAEAARLEAERIAEAARLEAERIAEVARLEAERAAEAARLEAERIAEEQRLAEAARLEAARIEEEKRIAGEKRLAEERAAEEKAAAEAKRVAEEKAAEAKRIAEEKAAEAKRIAEAKRVAGEKAAAEAKRVAEEKAAAEANRVAAEKRAAEAARLEAERIAKEKAAAEKVVPITAKSGVQKASPGAPASPAAPAAARAAASAAVNGKTLNNKEAAGLITQTELTEESLSKWYVVQLSVSDEQPNTEQLPQHEIFAEYQLYTVACAVDGRLQHVVRLGFFGNEGGALAVAAYMKAFFENPTTTRVSVAEHDRFSRRKVKPPPEPLEVEKSDRTRVSYADAASARAAARKTDAAAQNGAAPSGAEADGPRRRWTDGARPANPPPEPAVDKTSTSSIWKRLFS
jgi:hypothetical protein